MGIMNEKADNILIVLSLVLVLTVSLTSLGIAYAGGVRGGGLASVCFLLTFGVMVVLAQVMPAGIFLGSLAGVAVSMVRRIELPIRAV
jgi:hypothetical protein